MIRSEGRLPVSDRLVLSDDLRLYIRHAWHVVEPSTVYLENWHIDLIAEYLENQRAWARLPLDEQARIYEALTRPAIETTATVTSGPDNRDGDAESVADDEE